MFGGKNCLFVFAFYILDPPRFGSILAFSPAALVGRMMFSPFLFI